MDRAAATAAIDRREFLALGSAPIVAAALGPAWAAAQGQSRPVQKFRVGHNIGPYLRLGGPPHEGYWKGVEELSSLGFKATEADDNLAKLSTVYATDTTGFRERLARHAMQMAALYHSLPVDDAARFDEGVDEGMRVGKFMRDVGIPIFNLAGGQRKPGGNPPEDFQALARLVNEVGKRLKNEYGIQLGYHPHTGNMIEKRAEIGRMMDMTDQRYFNLCPDTGHLVAGGSDALEVFRTYRSRIIYLHFKDWDPNMVTARTAETGRKGGFPELGEGIVPLPQLADFLLGIGYDKWVMIEIDSSRTTPLDSATKDLKYMTDRLKLKVG
ncbi:MAG TPA: TIM barrel protein [Vicinamibacterales bacterium]|nr:TIM barrel protein [Vicinamibacterales bacterium]